MLLSVGEAISVSLSKEFFCFGGNNETFSLAFWRRKKQTQHIFIHSLAQRTNQETFLLLSLTQRKKQRNIRPSKASPQGEDATQENAETAIFLPFK